ncbi:hypothetical protein JRQ81_011169 [Phrynocephalus forsythii]|uniref:Metalloendopeptidase n=1 Tax=Phrynocephalus forsythii TaxID=171643 RepID=A0A9Q1AR26_9SAUR|nr:hypothetical protein JRQ81_011169 [Phrynocephalus forsythii]
MDGSLGIWLIGFLWLLTGPPVHGRGDTFEAEHIEGEDADEAGNPSDDILDVKQAPSLPEGPESSFLMEGGIIQAVSHEVGQPLVHPGLALPGLWGEAEPSRDYKSSVKIIQEALEDFARFTCIHFVPYSYQRNVVTIAPLSGCFSSIGRIGGKQVVSLAPVCLRRGKRVVLHELRHVLSFWHQLFREDQDKDVGISWNEILTGFEMHFLKSQKSNMLVDYDYSSVLHYDRNAFSMAGLPTTIPLFGASTSLGQRWKLSMSDIDQVNQLYECSQAAAQPGEEVMGLLNSTGYR